MHASAAKLPDDGLGIQTARRNQGRVAMLRIGGATALVAIAVVVFAATSRPGAASRAFSSIVRRRHRGCPAARVFTGFRSGLREPCIDLCCARPLGRAVPRDSNRARYRWCRHLYGSRFRPGHRRRDRGPADYGARVRCGKPRYRGVPGPGGPGRSARLRPGPVMPRRNPIPYIDK